MQNAPCYQLGDLAIVHGGHLIPGIEITPPPRILLAFARLLHLPRPAQPGYALLLFVIDHPDVPRRRAYSIRLCIPRTYFPACGMWLGPGTGEFCCYQSHGEKMRGTRHRAFPPPLLCALLTSFAFCEIGAPPLATPDPCILQGLNLTDTVT